jgi:hypothetical protein
MTKKMRRLLRDLRPDVPLVIEDTRGGHIKLILPNGAVVYCAGTPSDRRTVRHVRASIRRAMRRL